MQVSVVVPTRNRRASLLRLLRSLAEQRFPLREVIVVDSSDVPASQAELQRPFPALRISYLVSTPSVCVQRNLGIRYARRGAGPTTQRQVQPGQQEGPELVFLCDDDMEVPPDYVGRLVGYLQDHPEVSAVSGLVIEPGQTEAAPSQYPVASLGELWFRFIFQLSLWGEITHLRASGLRRVLYRLLERYYTRKGNDVSGAGWPVVTCFQPPAFCTRIWGLGASIVRLDRLGDAPFDEVLDPNGIGDNYDVCLQLPGERPVAVLTEAHVSHHKSEDNRLPSHVAHFRRTLALHYFLRKHPVFSRWNRLLFLWSLLGQYLTTFRSRERDRRRDLRTVVGLIVTDRNPYVLARKQAVSAGTTPGPERP